MPWQNGLASRRMFWTCVQLAFCLATHLRRLASACDDLRGLCGAQIWTQVDASFFYRLATQREFITKYD